MPEFYLGPINAEAKQRLKDCKVKLPTRLPKGRNPTASDLLEAVGKLPPDYVVVFDPKKPKVGNPWYFDIKTKKKPKNGPSALIEIDFAGMDEELPLVYFMTGWPAPVFAVAVALAKLTGPLLLDGEDGPYLVLAEDEADNLAALMEGKAAKAMKRVQKRLGMMDN